MFSTHLPQIHRVPRELIFAGAGVVLIVSLLIAIASVASGEVRKAQQRDVMLASQRMAATECFGTQRGAALNDCLRLARAEAPGSTFTLASNDKRGSDGMTLADNSGFTRSASGNAPAVQGFMPVALGSLR